MTLKPPVVRIPKDSGTACGVLLDGGYVLSAQHVLLAYRRQDLKAVDLDNVEHLILKGSAVIAAADYTDKADLAVGRLAASAPGVVNLALTREAALAGKHTLYIVRDGRLVAKPVQLTPGADPAQRWSHNVADTDHGDSGSPIFRDDGVLVAIHTNELGAYPVYLLDLQIKEMVDAASKATQAQKKWTWVSA